MKIDFEGRRIVLSGATSDIGRDIARTLAECGARLVLLGRNAPVLEEARAGLAGDGHEQVAIDLDATQTIHDRLKPVLAAAGPIYGLCHCAGMVQTRPLASSKPEAVQAQLNVNLMAGLELSRLITNRTLALPGDGSIVFISSVYAHVGAPGQIGYCASKGAVNAAVKAMAVELAPRNIRVNSISPGFVRTEMTTASSGLSAQQLQDIIDRHPLGEGLPADVSRAVVFLLDPLNRWISGSDLIVDGGYTAR